MSVQLIATRRGAFEGKTRSETLMLRPRVKLVKMLGKFSESTFPGEVGYKPARQVFCIPLLDATLTCHSAVPLLHIFHADGAECTANRPHFPNYPHVLKPLHWISPI